MDKVQIGQNFFIPMPDNHYWTLGKCAGNAWSDGKNLIQKEQSSSTKGR